MDTLARDRERLEIPRRSRWEYAARAVRLSQTNHRKVAEGIRRPLHRCLARSGVPPCPSRRRGPCTLGQAGFTTEGHTFGGELWRGLTLKVALHQLLRDVINNATPAWSEYIGGGAASTTEGQASIIGP